MKKKLLFSGLAFCALLLALSSCKTVTVAYDDLNSGNEESIQLTRETNTLEVLEYLEKVLQDVNSYELKAYNRNPFTADNNKNVFVYHCFYAFFRDGEFQHTLGFSQTPAGSVNYSCWILDKISDLESMELYLQGDNVWNVEEYTRKGRVLDIEKSIAKMQKKINKETKFWGAAGVRDFPWYLQIAVWTLPIPVIPAATVFIGSIGKDNCVSAVVETMVWKKI